MKKLKTTTFMIFCLLMLSIMGCKNECKKVDCINGACLEGNCLCNAGWTGAKCDQKDECYQRTCVNGYCADGGCVCDLNYEGNTCSTPVNQKFAGTYYVKDSSTLYHYNDYYQIVITPLADALNEIWQ